MEPIDEESRLIFTSTIKNYIRVWFLYAISAMPAALRTDDESEVKKDDFLQYFQSTGEQASRTLENMKTTIKYAIKHENDPNAIGTMDPTSFESLKTHMYCSTKWWPAKLNDTESFAHAISGLQYGAAYAKAWKQSRRGETTERGSSHQQQTELSDLHETTDIPSQSSEEERLLNLAESSQGDNQVRDDPETETDLVMSSYSPEGRGLGGNGSEDGDEWKPTVMSEEELRHLNKNLFPNLRRPASP
ncbi:uncharacterized protein IL334_002259 [Kwoniella shivajii]|uniref:Uncharacterized protein n=1 Tax=Kwoniella shivajii TaxID=564305 RepID=A0ABZ1CX89_9TREE|nr:hypothetical protein IL334_002259 [Kwoniella shivajii]